MAPLGDLINAGRKLNGEYGQLMGVFLPERSLACVRVAGSERTGCWGVCSSVGVRVKYWLALLIPE